MSMKIVDVHEAQTHLMDLLSLAGEGTEVVIAIDGTPLARLVPVAASGQPRLAGLHRGAIWTSDDFDAPLPEDFWTGAT